MVLMFMSDAIRSAPVSDSREILLRLRSNISHYIKGKDDVIDKVLICLVASGHLLIEDLPGLGKTTLAYCLARSIDASFSRIQFTSDLLPADVIGVSVYDESTRGFQFKKGQVFANIVLADEINRTTPKTQSSLLEVMDRGKVSVDGETYEVGSPFMVFATQNPVDYGGTFPLPESQLDRFLMRIHMGYPGEEQELEVLRNSFLNYDDISMENVVGHEEILAVQRRVWDVYVEDSILEYIIKIATATRTETEFKAGVSTRGSLSLKMATQARALYYGRDFVLPEDVEAMVDPVLCHRLQLRRQTPDPLEERKIARNILRSIMDSIPSPV
jgi:MoxR-like ATPase